MLGRHVVGSSQHLPGHCQRRVAAAVRAGNFAQFCNSQIQQLHCRFAAGGHFPNHDVFRFQIAVHHAHRVRRIEYGHDRLENLQRFSRCESPASFQLCVERMALDVFHDHVDHAVAGGAQIINSDGIRMTKAPRRLALASKTAQPFGIVPHLRRQDLDGHAVAEQDVTRAVDGAHAAFAQHCLDLILAIKNSVNER